MMKFAIILSAIITAQLAKADTTPLTNLTTDFIGTLLCANPLGEDEGDAVWVKYVRRQRSDDVFTYIEFHGYHQVFSTKQVTLENGTLTLEFSAAGVGQMYNDKRLQERVIFDLKSRTAKRIQDINGTVSDTYSRCKLFPNEDLTPQLKWIRSIR